VIAVSSEILDCGFDHSITGHPEIQKQEVGMRFTQFISKLHREEAGQDLLEYALVLLAVLTAVVVGSGTLASTISTALGTINGKIQAAIS